MVSINAIKLGDVVYSVSSERAGNSMCRRQVVRDVKIVSVDTDRGLAVIEASGKTMTVDESRIKSYRRNRPVDKGLF